VLSQDVNAVHNRIAVVKLMVVEHVANIMDQKDVLEAPKEVVSAARMVEVNGVSILAAHVDNSGKVVVMYMEVSVNVKSKNVRRKIEEMDFVSPMAEASVANTLVVLALYAEEHSAKYMTTKTKEYICIDLSISVIVSIS
jgi:hypothetical protein